MSSIKNLIIFSVLLFNLTSFSFNELNLKNYCKLPVVCTDISLKCDFLCKGDFKHSCGGSICSTNASTCHKIKKERFKIENNNLNMCPFIYTLQSDDFCLNEKTCVYIDPISRLQNYYKVKKCNCKGKYGFKCGDKYCTINNKACLHLKININKIKSFNKC